MLNIEKYIVYVIVGDMIFDPIDIINSDSDSDVKEHAFGSEVERNVVICQCAQKVTLAKEGALSLFQRRLE